MSPLPPGVKRAAAGTALAGGTWLALESKLVQRADVRVGDALRELGTPLLDRAVTATTDLGSIYGVVGTAAVLLAVGRREAAEDTLAVGLAAWALAQTNKRFVRRQRPYDAEGVRRLIRPPTGSSFPSGHAAVGLAMMARSGERARSRPAEALLGALGAYVGLSRVYVGVHYPSDVLGGAGLGLIIAGLWRGPIAAVGRSLITMAAKAIGRTAPAFARAALLIILGVRLRRREGADTAPAERPAA